MAALADIARITLKSKDNALGKQVISSANKFKETSRVTGMSGIERKARKKELQGKFRKGKTNLNRSQGGFRDFSQGKRPTPPPASAQVDKFNRRKAQQKTSPREIKQRYKEAQGAKRKAISQKKANQTVREPRKAKQTVNRTAFLDGVKTSDNLFKNVANTAAVLGKSGYRNIAQDGGWKRAAKGTLQTSAVSAVGHGGLAALQGEDPWEAAKTGAIRGAFVGAGYQGLKAATHTNMGSIRGNLRQMGSTTKQAYKAHTTTGNAAIRGGQEFSPQLKPVFQLGQGTSRIGSIFGF